MCVCSVPIATASGLRAVSGAGSGERALRVVKARQRDLGWEPLAGLGCYGYVGGLPLKFFVAPVSRLFFSLEKWSRG